jgi:hypothetical protein
MSGPTIIRWGIMGTFHKHSSCPSTKSYPSNRVDCQQIHGGFTDRSNYTRHLRYNPQSSSCWVILVQRFSSEIYRKVRIAKTERQMCSVRILPRTRRSRRNRHNLYCYSALASFSMLHARLDEQQAGIVRENLYHQCCAGSHII